jgi:hypothetical protein
MTVAINSQTGHGSLVIDITGSASTHNLGNIANPEGVPLAILEATLVIVTAGLATCDLHIGVGAASAGVSNNDCGDNVPVDGTAAKAYALVHPTAVNTEITVPAIWTAAKYLTFYTDTAYSTGFVAKLFVRYVRLTD